MGARGLRIHVLPKGMREEDLDMSYEASVWSAAPITNLGENTDAGGCVGVR